MTARVVSIAADGSHRFSKPVQRQIELEAGLGVVGDAHCGVTVKHRSRVSRDPSQPNRRQVHLLHQELLQELASQGFTVSAGDMGENILTRGIDLLALPQGTVLRLGDKAAVQITGLRNPCRQLDDFQPGLMAATLGRDAQGGLVRKAGVMAVVLESGTVRPGDLIETEMPSECIPLVPV